MSNHKQLPLQSADSAPDTIDTGPASNGRVRIRGRIVPLFPASTLVLAPYLGLIVPIAIIEHNPLIWFILGLLGLALLGTIIAECILLPLRLRPDAPVVEFAPSATGLKAITTSVLAISVVAKAAYIASGGGSLLSQLTGEQRSTTTSLAALFAAWNLFACGLLFVCAQRGVCRKRTLWAGITILTLIELVGALQTTVTAPLVQFVSATLLVALVLGFVRLRTLIMALIIILLAWPTLFAVRNALRVEMGAAVDSNVSAFDRLRFDEQLTAVARFDVPVNAGQLDGIAVLRYGIVPRVLDSGRPNISSARLINEVLGASPTSSFNFLSIGTIYFFYGPISIVLFYFVAGLVFCLIVSRAVRAGPIATCMVMLAASYLFGWALTFPDTIVAYMQALVSFVPILIALLAFRRREPRPARQHG